MTLRADGAGRAAAPIEAATALLVETCATLAVQAARRGDVEAARYLLEQALGAIAAQARRDRPP